MFDVQLGIKSHFMWRPVYFSGMEIGKKTSSKLTLNNKYQQTKTKSNYTSTNKKCSFFSLSVSPRRFANVSHYCPWLRWKHESISHFNQCYNWCHRTNTFISQFNGRRNLHGECSRSESCWLWTIQCTSHTTIGSDYKAPGSINIIAQVRSYWYYYLTKYI